MGEIQLKAREKNDETIEAKVNISTWVFLNLISLPLGVNLGLEQCLPPGVFIGSVWEDERARASPHVLFSSTFREKEYMKTLNVVEVLGPPPSL